LQEEEWRNEHYLMLSDEMRYKLLRLLEANPRQSQREVARQLGISLGKVNFCMKALAEKGMVKATNFKNSSNKTMYMYLLTPRGFEEKARVTVRFLRRKLSEYEGLREEIEKLWGESQANNRVRGGPT
jgi:EPS-associated MarR family transcriptional regulator